MLSLVQASLGTDVGTEKTGRPVSRTAHFAALSRCCL